MPEQTPGSPDHTPETDAPFQGIVVDLNIER